MRPKGSAEVLAARRRRALKLLDKGLSLNEVAHRVGCQASSVMRWRDRRAKVGEKVFEVGTSPGRPCKLSPQQKRHLVKLIAKGPLARDLEQRRPALRRKRPGKPRRAAKRAGQLPRTPAIDRHHAPAAGRRGLQERMRNEGATRLVGAPVRGAPRGTRKPSKHRHFSVCVLGYNSAGHELAITRAFRTTGPRLEPGRRMSWMKD